MMGFHSPFAFAAAALCGGVSSFIDSVIGNFLRDPACCRRTMECTMAALADLYPPLAQSSFSREVVSGRWLTDGALQ